MMKRNNSKISDMMSISTIYKTASSLRRSQQKVASFLRFSRIAKVMTLAVLLVFVGLTGQANTYYLTLAGAGSAQTPGSWNTIAGGGGTAASNFTTTGDIFNIPSGINGVISSSVTFGDNGANCGITVNVIANASLTISSSSIVTLAKKNGTTALNVNGTIIFQGITANQIVILSGGGTGGLSFTLGANGILKTANPNGIKRFKWIYNYDKYYCNLSNNS